MVRISFSSRSRYDISVSYLINLTFVLSSSGSQPILDVLSDEPLKYILAPFAPVWTLDTTASI